MTTGGVAQRIIRFSIACVGHLPGGLAITGVFACMLFAVLSGSSPATVMAIGSIIIGGMRHLGYSKDLAAGVICTAGALGILIPPSIVMVVYPAVPIDHSRSQPTPTSAAFLFWRCLVPTVSRAFQ
jgi:C4-dicarboxylate transporter DctM subunit